MHPHWVKAMQLELSALHRTATWDLTSLPPGKSIVGCRWVYKVKTRADGSIERYKARLVARGFTQEHGLDYDETFAPVARMTTVRVLLALAALRNWDLHQMDVKNAFLNGDLKEEVYMEPPQGLEVQSGQVCRLKKALYGLKQAPRAWFEKFRSTVLQFGFQQSLNDYALFIRRTTHGDVFLLLYVDDMILTGSDIQGISKVKQYLARAFEMTDMGQLSYFLGIEVSRSSSGYFISQMKYATEILRLPHFTDDKVCDTPLAVNTKLRTTDGELLSNPTLYRQLVGMLTYLTITRPDIAHAVHVVSQFMATPRSIHYAAILRIIRYLRGTLHRGLLLSSSSLPTLIAYSDADWAGDVTDRRSTTGYLIFLGNSLISWKSKKQDTVSRSSAESEYRALADTTAEVLWLRRLLVDFGISFSAPTSIHCDSKSAIQITHNDVFHERTKHIELDCHLARHHYQLGNIALPYLNSHDQLADLLTKAHSAHRFSYLRDKLQLLKLPAPKV